MKICFVLPGPASTPSGGYRMVYEYAIALTARGHSINILHPAYLSGFKGERKISSWRKTYSRYLIRKLLNSWSPIKWFNISGKAINLLWSPSISELYVPDGDIVIATHWHTAEAVAALPSTKGIKFYFIQGLEIWGGSDERVYKTWKLPLRKIVISKWLLDVAASLNENAYILPNGLNFDKFSCDVPIEKRDKFKIGMMFHELELKGSKDAFSAIIIAKKKFPEINVVAFGTVPKPSYLPEYFHYHQSPSQAKLNEIYNSCSIFLAPSHGEGWGLTASEAMMCGAAVIATDTVGHREFIEDKVSGIFCKPKDHFDMAEKLLGMLADYSFVCSVSQAASIKIRAFDIDSSVSILEEILISSVD